MKTPKGLDVPISKTHLTFIFGIKSPILKVFFPVFIEKKSYFSKILFPSFKVRRPDNNMLFRVSASRKTDFTAFAQTITTLPLSVGFGRGL